MTHIVEAYPEVNGALDPEGNFIPLSDLDDSFGAEYPKDVPEEVESAVEVAPSPRAAMAKRAILPYRYEDGEDAYSDLGGGLPGRPVYTRPEPKIESGNGAELVHEAKRVADAAAGIDINSTEYKVKERAAAEKRGRRY